MVTNCYHEQARTSGHRLPATRASRTVPQVSSPHPIEQEFLMSGSVKSRLGAMMFLQYAIWGSWYVTLNTYLTQTLHFTGTEAGAAFGTVSVAAIVSPFFVGLVADRFFSTERVMAVLYAAGAVFMLLLTRATSFGSVYVLLLGFCLCYFPTISLSNSIAMQQVADPGRDFPPIRVLGTLGWIAVNLMVGWMGVEATTTPFVIAAVTSVAMCLYSLALLPHTPPRARETHVSARGVLGLDALAMLKDRSYLVFVIASVLACIPLTFYYSFTNTYLNDVGVVNAAGKMTLGQASEVGMMLAMPIAFRLMNVRGILLLGLLAWVVRYVLLALGDPGAGVWMFYVAILLHGVCYDFFFVAGQLYTDQAAPAHLRSTAQGFITVVTYGVGMLIGSLLSGGVLDYFSTSTAGAVVRNWSSFWMSAAAMSGAITVLVLLFFRAKVRVGAAAT
jgi:nucleoside transporter